MKRFVSLFLAFAVLFSFVPSVGAVGSFPSYYFDHAANIAAAAEENAEKYTFPSNVTIYTNEIHTIMKIVYNEYPQLYNLSTSYSYSYSTNPVTGLEKVIAVIFNYSMDAETYAAAKLEVEKWADGIMSLTDSSFTDFEYALFFHDYLVMNYEYDTTYTSRSVYSMIKDGRGVCQAYTYAYAYLLKLAGVECSYAVSDSMNHVWNTVKINGEWYHVDVTWDDPTGGIPGRVYHDFFLISDTDIASEEKGHYNWESPYDCTSALYDAEEYTEITSPFAYTGGEWYYVNDGDLYVTDDITVPGELFMDMNLKWYTWSGTGYYVVSFSTVVAKNGKLYLNGSEEIYEIDPVSKTVTTAYTYTGGDGYIYGFVFDMGDDKVSGAGLDFGEVKLSIMKDPNGTFSVAEAQIFIPVIVIKGDINGDGAVNVTDHSYFKRAIKGIISVNIDRADMNEDGVVDSTDFSVLSRVIKG